MKHRDRPFDPDPIEVEIISIRALVAGSLTLPLDIHWHGALYRSELERVVPAAREPGRAALHQALRAYFTNDSDAARQRLKRIGYRLPSLEEGDIVLTGALAFIVTLTGEFALATHNRGIRKAALLAAARRDPGCDLDALALQP